MKLMIVGAGLIGRLMALAALEQHPRARLTIVDQRPLTSQQSCGWQAGGMVAPYCEAASLRTATLCEQGRQALASWPQLLQQLGSGMAPYHVRGTLVAAHAGDESELRYFVSCLQQYGGTQGWQMQSRDEVTRYLEPDLAQSRLDRHYCYIADEAIVDVPRFFSVTTEWLQHHPQVRFTREQADDGSIWKRWSAEYDWVVDARGLGAATADQGLRGVRGEAMLVQAPEVQLSRCLRLMHPRHPLYIVPRGGNRYYVGATAIETDDTSPISVVSALTLLSALYSVHPGFAEARILQTFATARPAYDDGHPVIHKNGNVFAVNGFYRHGYLLGPQLCQQVAACFHTQNGEVYADSCEWQSISV